MTSFDPSGDESGVNLETTCSVKATEPTKKQTFLVTILGSTSTTISDVFGETLRGFADFNKANKVLMTCVITDGGIILPLLLQL